jgi:hypothetical protein
MKAMRWIGLAALLAVGVALFASTPVQAGKGQAGQDAATWELFNTGVEPLATGQCSLTKPRLEYCIPYYGWICSYQVTVTCQNLTPGATYSADGMTFTAKPNGSGKVAYRGMFGPNWVYEFYLHVDRLDPDGSSVTVLQTM